MGALGHGDHEDQWQPTMIEAFAGQRVVAIAAAWQHSLALAANVYRLRNSNREAADLLTSSNADLIAARVQ